MSYIKNREELLAHGEIGLRAQALELIDAGILNADPYQKTKELVQIKDGVLQVGKQRFLLEKYQRIYVLGAGKATYPIAKALSSVSMDRRGR